jgi:oxygen-independent coproporphyrinogen-3 oxidase
MLPPLSLYVHLPWCLRKCPYCDFNSYEARSALPEQGYVDALLRDLDAEATAAVDRPMGSIFIGGGTPSLFSGAAIERLLDGIRTRVALAENVEISLEANPGAVEAGRFEEFRSAGINRLSIGIQSFRDEPLRRLGRVHGAAEAARAVELARRAGFDNINIDLMYGLPGDDLRGALSDLETAVDLGPAHLSWYQLTLEPGTAFHRRPPQLPAEEEILEIEQSGRAMLAQRGYRRYEISAYERPGYRCAHNLNYWQFGDYLGIGAGAHGKITLPAEAAIERRTKQRNPRTYVELAGSVDAATVERIDVPGEIVLEFMMNALRLPEGVTIACYEERTGQPFSAIEKPAEEARRRGWLAADPAMLRPTAAGLQVLNALLALF